MKKMNNRWQSVLLSLALFGLAACTGDFEDINRNPNQVTDDQMDALNYKTGTKFKALQSLVIPVQEHMYQFNESLSGGPFGGYIGATVDTWQTKFETYNPSADWRKWPFANVITETYTPYKGIVNGTEDEVAIAFARLLRVAIMHRVTDYYGPIVYTNFADPKGEYLPDSQEKVYNEFFLELDTAVTALADYIERKPDASEFARFDILLDGEYSSWIKFANSLRMRLAMRLAVVSPDKARMEFVKAFENSYGVFETPDEQAAVSTQSGYSNPLGELNLVWKETYMSASMESIMNGYDDPRRKSYFTHCSADELKQEYRGIRQGTCFAHNRYNVLSKLTVTQATDAVLMTAAEVWFLRAEAALRGWTSEEESDCYENGVIVSFQQHNVTQVDEYLNSDKVASDFIDVYDPENNIEARCLVSPRWIEEADDEVKLEKIITQKWLAIFPEGCEAWAEQRRTGYPRLFPVRFNNSKNGCIDTETMIRRLNFPGSLITENESQYRALVDALGGEDNAGTRLWWDTGRNW